MKPYKTYFEDKYEICIYGLLFISALAAALLAVKNIRISPDSMIYALISQEIRSGNGITLPIIYDLNDNYAFIDGAVPYLAQPPLLPMLFALLGGVTPQNFLAAQIINVISHVATAFFSFLLMKKLYDNKAVALLTGILVSVSLPLVSNAHSMLSESLFVALTTAALYFIVLTRHSGGHQSIRYYFIASICAGAAISTRFAGVALIPVFLWEVFVLVRNKSIKSKGAAAVLSAMLPLIAIGALFIRNYFVSGTIVGWNPYASERPYTEALTGTLKMLFLQFQLGGHLVAPFMAASVLFILYIVATTDGRKKMTECVHSGLDLLVVFMLSYTALITHALARVQPLFEVRYISPLAPFLFIICILVIVVLWDVIRFKGFSKLSLFGMILSLGIIIFGNLYKTCLNAEPLFSRQTGHYRILNSPTYNWIKQNYDEDVVITTNRPFHLSFFGGYPTVRLSHRRFNRNDYLPDNMESFLPARMSRFGSRVLVLFEEVDEQNEGSYLTGLFNKREGDDRFVLMQKLPDGVIYNLKE
ncbi:MAG: glycosyltransferase family 39 protein [Nitrospirae bacterium]|nr:glycosyltransferase family 39 protein [Nitrospirota bacterium]